MIFIYFCCPLPLPRITKTALRAKRWTPDWHLCGCVAAGSDPVIKALTRGEKGAILCHILTRLRAPGPEQYSYMLGSIWKRDDCTFDCSIAWPQLRAIVFGDWPRKLHTLMHVRARLLLGFSEGRGGGVGGSSSCSSAAQVRTCKTQLFCLYLIQLGCKNGIKGIVSRRKGHIVRLTYLRSIRGSGNPIPPWARRTIFWVRSAATAAAR